MRKILQDKINMNDINKICIMTQGKENDHRKEELYQLTFDENDRVFQDLRVWTPASDGTGSLRTLQEVGVGAISLAAGSSEFALRTSDNRSLGQIRATSAYLREDGGAGTVQQVDLSA